MWSKCVDMWFMIHRWTIMLFQPRFLETSFELITGKQKIAKISMEIFRKPSGKFSPLCNLIMSSISWVIDKHLQLWLRYDGKSQDVRHWVYPAQPTCSVPVTDTTTPGSNCPSDCSPTACFREEDSSRINRKTGKQPFSLSSTRFDPDGNLKCSCHHH